MIAPRRKRGPDRDAGVTLVELTVVLLVLSILLSLVYTFLYEMQRDQVTVSSRDFASGEAQAISDELSRQIHAAAVPSGSTSAIVQAEANQLQFYSSLGNANGPTELLIYTTPSCSGCTSYNLMEQVTQPGAPTTTGGPPVYTGSTATVTTSVIGSGLVLPIPSPSSDCPPTSGSFTPGLFEYFNSASVGGLCLPMSNTGSPPSGSPLAWQLTTGLSSQTSNQAAAVEHLTVTITTLDPSRPKTSATTTITEQITLPNVDYYNENTTPTTT
jgi:prepilin-type N-terminal cleavage/methylation domain-containing protein